jgi:hypothetical protein
MQQEIVTVATYPQAIEAHAARHFLEGHDIRAFVADEYTVIQSWSNYIEAKVQVPAKDAERAKELLATQRCIA